MVFGCLHFTQQGNEFRYQRREHCSDLGGSCSRLVVVQQSIVGQTTHAVSRCLLAFQANDSLQSWSEIAEFFRSASFDPNLLAE